jgi:GMP synthase (glutamine-hydrolysing)
LSRRILHLVNSRGSGAELFLPPLLERGFDVVDVHAAEERLPERLDGFDAVLMGGGTADVHQKDELPWMAQEVELARQAVRDGVPTLGLCLGAQILTEATGGVVRRSQPPEIGWHEVEARPQAADDPVFSALPQRFLAFQWHYYACAPNSHGELLAQNGVAPQAIRFAPLAWGTQFHIEVTREILRYWWRSGGAAYLIAEGYTLESFEASLDRHLPAHEGIGRALGERFAAVAAERAS